MNLAIALFLALSFACSHVRPILNSSVEKAKSSQSSQPLRDKRSGMSERTLAQESESGSSSDLDSDSTSTSESESTEAEEEVASKIVEFPIEKNSEVEKWINYFTKEGADKERFLRFLSRGKRYRKVVQTILKENDLPPELYYLAMIESGYSTHARSSAKAVGVWQFIAGTAQRYNLETSYYVDERKDPIRSTEAAAKYLTDLYMAFQSWPLAISAYNAGEYRILGAIIKGKSRDFWELAEKKILPAETRDYVPKFMAAVLIGENPKQYGMDVEIDSSEEENQGQGELIEFPSVSVVEVPSPIYLKDIANVTKISLEMLMLVNPHLTRGITPPHVSSYELWIPEGLESQLENSKDKLSSMLIKNAKQKFYYPQVNKNYHLVKKGEGLLAIARKYNMSVRHLKELNHLRSNKIIAGRRLRISTQKYRPR